MEKKINLQCILDNILGVPKNFKVISGYEITKKECKLAMLEFGKQLLKLAAENAKARSGDMFINGWGEKVISAPYVIEESITNVIKQVESWK